MKKLIALLTVAGASPALAASGPFFSLRNTDFVVLIAFLIFVGVLVYYKVPALIGGLLDKRAAGIQADLNEAKALREEAQTILAQYERKQREVQALADEIVVSAKRDAQAAAEQAKLDLQASIARRLKSAEEQIASAEAGALREVRNSAVSVAIAAASEILAKQTSASDKSALIDAAIADVETRFH
ncbi:F0F1 ATP synthase subunit B [Albirhodobacter sp. R86504]|uniref:F0F1 ATP synthase subunit B n=1 Tax=Albirhodobacter sp. R86504 TaxID=3093848 RepID=UPI00366DEAF4